MKNTLRMLAAAAVMFPVSLMADDIPRYVYNALSGDNENLSDGVYFVTVTDNRAVIEDYEVAGMRNKDGSVRDDEVEKAFALQTFLGHVGTTMPGYDELTYTYENGGNFEGFFDRVVDHMRDYNKKNEEKYADAYRALYTNDEGEVSFSETLDDDGNHAGWENAGVQAAKFVWRNTDANGGRGYKATLEVCIAPVCQPADNPDAKDEEGDSVFMSEGALVMDSDVSLDDEGVKNQHYVGTATLTYEDLVAPTTAEEEVAAAGDAAGDDAEA